MFSDWNSLSDSVVTADSVNTFESRLDTWNGSQTIQAVTNTHALGLSVVSCLFFTSTIAELELVEVQVKKKKAKH